MQIYILMDMNAQCPPPKTALALENRNLYMYTGYLYKIRKSGDRKSKR